MLLLKQTAAAHREGVRQPRARARRVALRRVFFFFVCVCRRPFSTSSLQRAFPHPHPGTLTLALPLLSGGGGFSVEIVSNRFPPFTVTFFYIFFLNRPAGRRGRKQMDPRGGRRKDCVHISTNASTLSHPSNHHDLPIEKKSAGEKANGSATFRLNILPKRVQK